LCADLSVAAPGAWLWIFRHKLFWLRDIRRIFARHRQLLLGNWSVARDFYSPFDNADL
jgi:hypothetical protein